MNADFSPKQRLYEQLVSARRACHACYDLGLTNPSRCQDGIHDNAGHIGPWTRWHGDLDATLMVVGQDWGGVEYYLEHKGIEEDVNPTNRNLVALLASIGIHIELPTRPASTKKIFLTNAVLCLKPGRLIGPVNTACFDRCGRAFLEKQIDLVSPKVVVTLGYQAYRATLGSYGLPFHTSMRKAVMETKLANLPCGATLIPVYHCGNNGLRSRSFAEQKADWKRVGNTLGTADIRQAPA
jgi:uracil-DNA glycosylase family 4